MVLLVGNWKMAPEKAKDALVLAKKTLAIARSYKKNVKTIVCVPSIHLPVLTKAIKVPLFLGGQTVAANSEIAQTGLQSAGMLASYGATHCIVGHSESRARGESDADVANAVTALLQKKITPIICIGEKERDAHGWYLSTVKSQVESIIATLPKPMLKKLIFAYEPVWAIGKDALREATTVECREMIIFIRKIIADNADQKIANMIPILYGGSVDEKNGASFVDQGQADGLLPGRLSLDGKRFALLAKSLNFIA